MRKIFAVAAVLTSSQLMAQTDTSGQTLNEVIVTANKFPQKQTTTGKVVTVIDREQIEKNVGRSLTQLLNEQAGITIGGALNNLGTNQTVYTRGAASGRTLILIDGIPVSDPSTITNELADLNIFSLQNIERIEVCRGAQSTLYGSDAVAGVINIITVKNNITKPLNVRATLSGGNYNTYKGNLQVYGKAGNLTYTTRYSKLKTEGFSAANDKDGKGDFDRDGYNGDATMAALQYQVTKEFLVKSFIHYNRYKADIDAGVFTDDKDYTYKNKALMTGAGFQFNKNAVRLVGNYQFADIDRNYHNGESDGSAFGTDDFAAKSQYAELYANIELGKNFSLLHGADYRYNSYNSRSFSRSSFGSYESIFRDTSHSQASLYASVFYRGLNEKLNIELGGRLNVHSEYGSNRTMTFNPSYSINEHFRAFGSIATGFKAPTLYQLYGNFVGNISLQPERSTTYELGVQQQHNKISNRLVYFHRDIKNGIDYNYVTSKYFNFFKQTVNGIEWETKYNPIKALTISANYTFLDGTEKTQSRVDFKDTSYSYLLRRPKHSINLNTGYQFTEALYVSVGGKYVSDRFDVGGYMKPDVKMDNYLILNAYAEYAFKKHLKIFADAQNITNKEFYDIRGFNSIPFLINGGVTFNW